ncbi:sigma-70 family RNA polymerase sigma factor [bacterium C-53]|nr:sigma-70 family RNA polymerase sigma factor [Lachnospiraceae bacterium]NBI02097.1 sigma-70 family RNA polymerase sigma factor [Lachnospiraceae bacterium]RKJ10448.1 sigma-70 family RNA polymerase sigma factor [bacterium C-53]
MKTFPKPLTASEESFYLKKYKAGDKEAGNILVERNLRLVAHIAKKYVGVGEDTEDLISIGTIGLIKAVSTFDDSKGRLVTYASRCIDNELLMMLRSRKKVSRDVSLYEPIGTDKEGNEISLLDVIESPEEDIAEAMDLSANMKKLWGYMDICLSAREREIIRLRYGFGRAEEVTQREIGEQLGISRSYVSRIEKKAIRKLRECYENNMD